MTPLKQLFAPYFSHGHTAPGYANTILLFLLLLGIANFSVGLYQSTVNHGDLSLIVRHAEYTLTTPEIYNNPENVHNIRYPINSSIVMAPIFAFYALGDNLIYYYLALIVIAILSLPWLLTTGLGIRLNTEAVNWQKIVFTIILATAATRVTLNVGQLGIIFFAIFLFSFNTAKEYPKLAAIALAIAISKPQMGLFFFIFMLLNAPLVTSLLAASIHVTAHAAYCYINDLNIFSTITQWIKWQLQFGDHAIVDNTGYVNSLHSIDMINLTRGLNLPDAVVFSTFFVFFVAGIILLYINRDDRLAQLAVLCIWPLFLFYHRPYDYFLLWGILPLLLQNRDYTGGIAALKLLAVGIMFIPYIPTFAFLSEFTAMRQIFYFIYTGLVVLLFLSITYISKRNLAMGYRAP
jgi:hypothetical protein